MKRLCIMLLAGLWLISILACAEIEIHFLDVGQGDAAIVICDGQSMMIDGGKPAASQFIYSYLKNTIALDHLDYMIASHPDADHIGGLSAALNACAVDRIYCSCDSYDSNTFNSLRKYADAQQIRIDVPSIPERFALGSADVAILAPVRPYADENSGSLVVRIDYGETSALFTGDISEETERDLIDLGVDLEADLLKVAHHGSRTSTSAELLSAVSPKYAVISVGADNAYGHPNSDVTDRIHAAGTEIYRTDLCGTIVFRSDGQDFSVQTEKTYRSVLPDNKAEYRYIGNRRSHKFHKSGCESVPDMKESNKVGLRTREEAVSQGFVPCKRCEP